LLGSSHSQKSSLQEAQAICRSIAEVLLPVAILPIDLLYILLLFNNKQKGGKVTINFHYSIVTSASAGAAAGWL
jgi:hypothetical protein